MPEDACTSEEPQAEGKNRRWCILSKLDPITDNPLQRGEHASPRLLKRCLVLETPKWLMLSPIDGCDNEEASFPSYIHKVS